MNNRIKQLAEQAVTRFDQDMDGSMEPAESGQWVRADALEKFAELLLRNLAEELDDVAKRNKKVNPEWANGMYNSAMLAQRMTMDFPQWPEAE
jgi:hypothetical protein